MMGSRVLFVCLFVLYFVMRWMGIRFSLFVLYLLMRFGIGVLVLFSCFILVFSFSLFLFC
jgi:hypothetical protein